MRRHEALGPRDVARGDRVQDRQVAFLRHGVPVRLLADLHHLDDRALENVEDLPDRPVAGDGDQPAVELEVHFGQAVARSEEHTSELQSLMRISYAVFCLKKKKITYNI